MKHKNTVFIGIVLSSFLTTLVLYQWINYLVTSFLIFVSVLTAAFYVALSQARAEKLSEKDMLINAVQRLDVQKQENYLIDQLIYWAGLLVKSETVFYYIPGDQKLIGEVEESEDWIEPCRELIEQDQITIWPGSTALQGIPAGVKNLLAVPVNTDSEPEGRHGLLVLYNRLAPGTYSSQDAALLRVLALHCESVLHRFSAQIEKERFYKDTITYLIQGSEDADFKGHARRVRTVAVMLGSKLGLTETELRDLDLAALLHDCGKMNQGPSQYAEEGQPSSAGADEHPQRGAEFFPEEERYTQIKQGILYHHERYNGSGFPEGLHHTEIPLMASAIAVADIFDALTKLGEEEQRLRVQEAFNVMKKETGTLFDPLVIVALEEIIPELLETEPLK